MCTNMSPECWLRRTNRIAMNWSWLTPVAAYSSAHHIPFIILVFINYCYYYSLFARNGTWQSNHWSPFKMNHIKPYLPSNRWVKFDNWNINRVCKFIQCFVAFDVSLAGFGIAGSRFIFNFPHVTQVRRQIFMEFHHLCTSVARIMCIQ